MSTQITSNQNKLLWDDDLNALKVFIIYPSHYEKQEDGKNSQEM